MSLFSNISKQNTKSYGNCGDIVFCLQASKRVYALSCLFCSQICLQFDIFINHMEEQHDEELRANLIEEPPCEPPKMSLDCFGTLVANGTVRNIGKHHSQKEQNQHKQVDSKTEPNQRPYKNNQNDPLDQTQSTCTQTIDAIKVEVSNFEMDSNCQLETSSQLLDQIDESQDVNEAADISVFYENSLHHNDFEAANENQYSTRNTELAHEIIRNNIKINIPEILNCPKGRCVLSFYKTDQCLNSKYRRILCDLIIDTIFEQGYIGCKDMPNIVEKIIKIFPTEDRSLYFKPRQVNCRRTPSGFLFHRYYNRLKQIKKRHISKRKRK